MAKKEEKKEAVDVDEFICIKCTSRWLSREDELPGPPMSAWLCPYCGRTGGVMMTGDSYSDYLEDDDADVSTAGRPKLN